MLEKFRKGDKVIVRLDSGSAFKGEIGIVDKVILDADKTGYFYYVKFKNVSVPIRFNEDQLEPSLRDRPNRKQTVQKEGVSMKNAAIYFRVSTDNQESEGTSQSGRGVKKR